MPVRVTRRTRLWPLAAPCLAALLLLPGEALAGPPGSGIPGGGGAPAGPVTGPKSDDDGPAEAAPKDKKALAPIEPVPAQPRTRRRLQLFELDGYIRMRADYFHRLDLDVGNANDQNEYPQFFRPPAEQPEGDAETGVSNDANCLVQQDAVNTSAQRASTRCERRKGITSANMRLRLAPILHVTDTVKVHTTIDVLDNLVLGSTPDSFAGDYPNAPIDIYTRSQTPPQEGVNSVSDSITVKRAFGHIHFGWGLDIKFGRMPQQWGMGIVANDGNGYDRQSGDDIIRMVDTDYGDSVDSLRFAFGLGKDKRRQHVLGFAYTWAATGPTTAQLLGPEWGSGRRVAQEFSAEKMDDVHQISLSLERRDDPAMLKRKLSLGTPVVNYGAIAWVRTQKVDRMIGSPGLGDGIDGDDGVIDELDPSEVDHTGTPLGTPGENAAGLDGLENYANMLVLRRAVVFTPDLWLRVNWRTLRIEIEGAMTMGRFFHRDLDSLVDSDTQSEVESDFLSGGYALEFKYGLFDDKFHIGFDQGFASGDATPPNEFDPQRPIQANAGGADAGPLNNFRFNPAYTQDLLLFKEIMGTAANAAYFRPWAAFYFFKKNMSARADVEYALAAAESGTPGGKLSYGLEIDGAIRYHDVREPIFVQAQYGVMFPFGGFDIAGGDAKAAQTVQGQIGIRF